jgi:hypothetical protein
MDTNVWQRHSRVLLAGIQLLCQHHLWVGTLDARQQHSGMTVERIRVHS